MSEQKIVGYRLPITPAMLDDVAAFGHVIERALSFAHTERAAVAEGRATTMDRIAITISPDTQPFDPKPDNLWWIDLRMTITITE